MQSLDQKRVIELARKAVVNANETADELRILRKYSVDADTDGAPAVVEHQGPQTTVVLELTETPIEIVREVDRTYPELVYALQMEGVAIEVID